MKKPHSILPFIILFSVFFISCKPKIKVEKYISPDEVIKADEAFSDLSRQAGMKKAFIEYIDNEGILLRPGHPPIVGADAIDFLSQLNDSTYTLTWQPRGGEIAAGWRPGVYLWYL